MHNINDMNNLQ